jgi:opacity protein-like surface antigen
MRTKQLTIITLLLLFTSIAGKAQIKGGLGLNYATDINSIGISINGQYDINKKLGATASFTYYFENSNVNWYAFDFNATYNLMEIGGMGKLYGIGGLNFTIVKVDVLGYYDWIGDSSTTDTNIGLNIGGGVNFDITDKISVAPETVLTISNGSYLRIGARVMYAF